MIEGDLIELAKFGRFDVIIHGCNCFCNMNAGFAKSIKFNFPEAYLADAQTIKGEKRKTWKLYRSYYPKKRFRIYDSRCIDPIQLWRQWR